MAKQIFRQQWEDLSSFSSSLPLTPGTLLWKEKKLINFSSRDYLGLSQHPEMRKNAIKYLLHYGSGICHPEIRNGYLECQQNIEEKYAEALGVSYVHFISTHSFALRLVLDNLLDKECHLFIDSACHALLRKEAQLWGGHVIFYSYKDLNILESKLATCRAKQCLILSESLFGTTGHIADLDALICLAKRYNAFLIMDDSHSFGVKGKQGFGLSQGHKDIDFILCRLDCAAGAQGSFITSAFPLTSHIFNNATYSRDYALSFSALGAIEYALEILPHLEGERMQLEQRTHWIRTQFNASEMYFTSSSSHLIALPCDSIAESIPRWNALLERNILSEINVVHHENEEVYLLFSINTYHTPDELSKLLQECETTIALSKK